ncbi:hypothetical protein A0H81_05938 [Grifola frondosa]|uniref:Flavin reductase like domain-containing protein n=1 Tax=Grifola frondosa TaxID=5627 RepID=A0A1C7MAZ1_GRIFR|nr:hypothetical protein A0H81_05938 [Grifola frondosa]
MDPHPSSLLPPRSLTHGHPLLRLHGSSSVAAHMVINILSAAQEPAAVQFSRPDLHPEPFTSTPYFLTKDGLPVLEGSLGALSCKLVAASWPLHDLEVLERQQKNSGTVWEGDGVASELFIAEVTRVEAVTTLEDSEDGLRTLPLLYHRRAYATTCGIPPKHHPPSTNQKQ